MPRLIPKILSVVLVFFLGLFALDAFDSGLPLSRQIIAFAIHLIPSLFLAVIAALAWRMPRLGGWLYIASAAFYVFTAWGKVVWTAFAVISGPLAITGLLFILQGPAAADKHGDGQKT